MKPLISSIYFSLIAVLLIPLMSACQQENLNADAEQEERYFSLYMGAHYPDAVPDANGLYYIEHEAGSGAQPEEGEWVRINYVGYSLPEEAVVDTHLENVAIHNGIGKDGAMYGPLKMEVGAKSEGVKLGLMKMQVGGKATFCFTSELGYGSDGNTLMQSIASYKPLKYEVELLEVIPDIEAYEAQELLSYVDTIPGLDTIHDPETDAFLYYIVDTPNDTGSVIKNDSVVHVAYTGQLIDGRIFDESAEGEPLEFQVGRSEVIAGWDLAMTRFKEGESGRVIIPYALAYGEAGTFAGAYVSIPAYATLVFEIEVEKVQAVQSDDEEED